MSQIANMNCIMTSPLSVVMKWACKNHENRWNPRFDVTSWFSRHNVATLCDRGHDVMVPSS
jgi:hypothetical protein